MEGTAMPLRQLLPLCCLALGLASTAGAAELTVQKAKDSIAVARGTQPVLDYQATPKTFKTYVRTLYTPAGVQVLRDSPHDHIHHHALMFAIGAQGIDFWGESPNIKPGKQVPRGEPVAKATARGVSIEQSLDWLRPGEKPVLAERRRILVHNAAAPTPTLRTWATRLGPAEGLPQTKLWGRHYFGLGIRFVTSMDKVGTFLNPTAKAGERVRGTEKLVRATWCAYTAPVGGKPVTVALFDHPDNARHPATWFTMTSPFAYIAATLNLHRQPMAVAKGKPLDLVYGVAAWDGAVEADAIQAAYERWKRLAPKPHSDQ